MSTSAPVLRRRHNDSELRRIHAPPAPPLISSSPASSDPYRATAPLFEQLVSWARHQATRGTAYCSGKLAATFYKAYKKVIGDDVLERGDAASHMMLPMRDTSVDQPVHTISKSANDTVVTRACAHGRAVVANMPVVFKRYVHAITSIVGVYCETRSRYPCIDRVRGHAMRIPTILALILLILYFVYALTVFRTRIEPDNGNDSGLTGKISVPFASRHPWWHPTEIRRAVYDDVALVSDADVDVFLRAAATGIFRIDTDGAFHDTLDETLTVFLRTDAMILFLARHPRFPCFVELGCRGHLNLETFLRRFLEYTPVETPKSVFAHLSHEVKTAFKDEYHRVSAFNGNGNSDDPEYIHRHAHDTSSPDVSLEHTELAQFLLTHIEKTYGSSEYAGGCVDATSIGRRVRLVYTSTLGILGDVVIESGIVPDVSDIFEDTASSQTPPVISSHEIDRELGTVVPMTRYTRVLFSAIVFDKHTKTWSRAYNQSTSFESDAICLQRAAEHFNGMTPTVHRILFDTHVIAPPRGASTRTGIIDLAKTHPHLVSFFHINLYSSKFIANQV